MPEGSVTICSEVTSSNSGRRTYEQAFPESSGGDAPSPDPSIVYPPKSRRGRDDRPQVDGLATVGVSNEDVASYGQSSTIAFVREVAGDVESQAQPAHASIRYTLIPPDRPSCV